MESGQDAILVEESKQNNDQSHLSLKVESKTVNTPRKTCKHNDSLKSDDLYQSIFQANAAPMILIAPDEDGRIIDANQRALDFYGYNYEELCSLHTWQINTLGKNVLPVMHEVHSWPGGHKPLSFQHITSDGSIRDVQTYVGPVEVKGRRLMLGVIHDITAQKEIEKFHQLLLESCHAGIICVDSKHTIIYANPTAARLLGFRHPSELISKKINEFSNLEDQTQGNIVSLISSVLFTNSASLDCEVYMKTRNGLLPYWCYLSPMLTSNIRAVAISFSEISRRKQLEEELKQAAQRDPLTKALNRRQFEKLLSDAHARYLRYGDMYSLIMIDADYFKNINDRYGHDVGDQVLIKLVNTLNNRLRESDHLCRWGGEEFLVLIPNSDIEQARALAKDLLICVRSENFDMAGKVTVSIGVAAADGCKSSNEAIKKADLAVYKSKNTGRDKVSSQY
ncbi:sensor domain-containing diguanylate cyclase [Marinobacterium stanieri]|nr:sensor domain-containing diguanylate cyclase [Marinobacterium stanieri]